MTKSASKTTGVDNDPMASNPGQSTSTSSNVGQSASTSSKAGQSATEISDQAKDAAESTANAAKAEASNAGHQAREALDEATSAARRKAQEKADEAKAHVANSADRTASQIRDAGGAFEPGSLINEAAQRLADNLAEAASAVRTADLRTVQSDLSAFARRNPLLFFGGAAALGFAAARMMKASDRGHQALTDDFDTSYGQADYAGSRADVPTRNRTQI